MKIKQLRWMDYNIMGNGVIASSIDCIHDKYYQLTKLSDIEYLVECKHTDVTVGETYFCRYADSMTDAILKAQEHFEHLVKCYYLEN